MIWKKSMLGRWLSSEVVISWGRWLAWHHSGQYQSNGCSQGNRLCFSHWNHILPTSQFDKIWCHWVQVPPWSSSPYLSRKRKIDTWKITGTAMKTSVYGKIPGLLKMGKKFFIMKYSEIICNDIKYWYQW